MKVINEKGKLFGVINIVDLLVVVFILAVLGGIAWKIFGDRISEAANEVTAARNSTSVTYTVRATGVSEDVADAVTSLEYPQQLAVNTGLVAESYIVSVTTEPSKALSVDREFAEMVEYDRVDLIFTIEAKVAKGDFITVGSQEVRIGKSHIVKSQFVEYSGVIESLDFERADFTQGK